MEKVFWLMWLADVVGSINVVGVIAMAVAALTVVAFSVNDAFQKDEAAGKLMRVMCWLAVPVVIAVVLPSSKTIQVIAIASAADAATETRLGKKGVEALDAVLDKIISVSKAK